MTRLDTQVTEVSQEFEQLLSGEDNRTLIDEYETAAKEVQEIGVKLREAVERRKVLRGSEEDFQLAVGAEVEQPLLKRLADGLTKVRQTWGGDRRKIRQGGAIGRLRSATDSYVQALDGNTTQSWEAWRKDVEAQVGVADAQLESIKHVMGFRDQVSSYQHRIGRFRSATRVVPRTPEALAAVRAIVEELKSIKGGFKFDLPAEVTAFYEALDRDGFVPLGSMAPIVEQWLADNNGLLDLQIVRRPMMRR